MAPILVAALLTSSALTGWMRSYAMSHRLLDVPNVRSSHVTPTPRGGGVGFVLVVLGALPLLARLNAVSTPVLWALFGSGAVVAAVGWIDDRRGVAARWRLLIHFIAAAWILAWIARSGSAQNWNFSPPVLYGVAVLGSVYLVWLLNLYNFMDGIDGIAGIEAVTVSLGGALLYILSGSDSGAWAAPALLAAAVAGFLYWNFPRARIFMGDAGSGFLGIVLGVMSLQAGAEEPRLFWSWLILLGSFIVDATVTLARRLARGEKVYEAHRSHAYQHAARKYGSHVRVSLAVGAINILWLFPCAALVAAGVLNGVSGVALAYAPLTAVALYFRAGACDE